MDKDYLPFTRPTLDDETIQGVVDVLRSGWITSGPMVEQLEKGLTEYWAENVSCVPICMPPAPWKKPWSYAASAREMRSSSPP